MNAINGISRPPALVAIFFNVSLALLFALLMTNAVPFVQMGILPDIGSKSRYCNIVRIPVILFALLYVLLRWQRPGWHQSIFPESRIRSLEGSAGLIIFFLSAYYFVSTLGGGIIRHWAWETRAFDFGIFAQAVANTFNGHLFASSIKGNINLMGDHFSPILLLCVPFHALWHNPMSILVAQALAMTSCIFLTYRIARDHTGSTLTALVFAAAFFLYLPARNVLRDDFHPEALVQPFMFLAFYFLMKRRLGWFLAMCAVVLMGKENMAGVTFALGLYACLFTSWRKTGIGIMVFSVVYFYALVHYVIPAISGEPYLYSSFYDGMAGDPGQLVLRLLNPGSLSYTAKVLAAVFFLPLFHLPTLMLAGPILAQNLLSENDFMRSFNFHYTVGMTPFIFISAIYGWQVLQTRFEKARAHKNVLLMAFMLLAVLRSGPSEYYYAWNSSRHIQTDRNAFAEKLQEIPADKSVLTHNNVIPQVLNRPYVYQFDYRNEPTKETQVETLNPDYVVMSVQFWEPETGEINDVVRSLNQMGYETFYSKGDHRILRRLASAS